MCIIGQYDQNDKQEETEMEDTVTKGEDRCDLYLGCIGRFNLPAIYTEVPGSPVT